MIRRACGERWTIIMISSPGFLEEWEAKVILESAFWVAKHPGYKYVDFTKPASQSVWTIIAISY